MKLCSASRHYGPALIAVVLFGCGGGGGSSVAIKASPPTATKLSSTRAPQGFGFSSYDNYVGLSSKTLLSKVPGFVVRDAKRTYVDIWYINEDGVRQQIFFGTVQALSTMDEKQGLSVRVPGNVPTLHYQIYDDTQTSPEVQV